MVRTLRTRKGKDRRDFVSSVFYKMKMQELGFKDRRKNKDRRVPRDLESPEDYAELDRAFKY